MATVPPSDLISDLNSDFIRVVFASGPQDVNREIINRMAARQPKVPLYVVGEFRPDIRSDGCEWIPYHVLRGFKENLAGIRAVLAGKRIESAAVILAPGLPFRNLKLIAMAVAGRHLTAYNEKLETIRLKRLPLHGLSRLETLAGSARTRKWMRRVAHPWEAEIPIRARTAQVCGVAANYVRAPQTIAPLGGPEPLLEGVTVIIPSRNGRDLLEQLLPSMMPQVRRGELIVSDNGSTDGTAEWLAREYPGVRIVRAEAPLSFARAINLGLASCRFERTLFLNNDMVVRPGFFAALDRAFELIPDLFCATAQIFFPAGVRREETGKAVWRRGNPKDFPVRCDDPVPGEDLTWVLYGSGGCSLFDTAKLRELGGVAELFEPAYVEDLDLGYRAWKRGWPSVFCAGAIVEHRHRATTSRYYTPDQLDGFLERNYLQFLIHAIGSRRLFADLWRDGIRRLQLMAMDGSGAALETLRHVPHIAARPPRAAGPLCEREILALGNGDVAIFPGSAASRDRTVLIASPFLPFPLSHGGAVRIFNLMKYAAAAANGGWNQVLIAFSDELQTPPHELLDVCQEVVLVRRHGTHYRKATKRPDTVEEFDSETFRACLKQTIQRWRPEVVQLEFTQMAQYAENCAPAKTALVEHDITFDLQEQLLAATPESSTERWETEQQLRKWREFETAAWRRVDCVVAMSSRDRAKVANTKRVEILANGVDTERFRPPENEPEPRRLLFIGSFAHLPNLLALDFFLREAWPLLGSSYVLHIIAGARHEYFLDFFRRRAAVSLDLNAPGIELGGFVSDVRSAYERATIALAPLTASAGTNIKVLEAMAMGRVVVATPAGIHGLDLHPDRDVMIARSGTEMAEKIRAIASDDQLRRSIERNARETALQYNWREIARRQSKLYDELTRASR